MAPAEDSQSPPNFTGIIPPVLTPLAGPDELDEAGCERLFNHLIEGGVNGLFLLGSSGELPSLSQRLRNDYIQKACQLIGQRVPVLIGITDNSVVETIALAHKAAESGADGVVLTTPFYYNISQAELKVYVREVLKEVDLPLLLYNMPGMTKIWYEFETVRELCEMEQIVGMKDSSKDMDYFRQLTTLKSIRPDWSLLVGHECNLAESLRCGGSGGVNVGANLFPHPFARLIAAHRAGDDAAVAEWQEKINRISRIYNVDDERIYFLKTTKATLSLMGICDDHLASPHQPCSDQQIEQIRDALEHLKSELS